MISIEIIKIGGNIINRPDELDEFLKDFSKVSGLKILVHGGGEKASEFSRKMNVPTQMIKGRRVTDKNALEIVTMVYAGLINKKIVAKLQSNCCNALGMTGADGNILVAHKRVNKGQDFGFVGDIDSINLSGLKDLFDMGLVPVFSAITHDGNGQLLNTNADTIAAELAIALNAVAKVKLTYVFDKDGVLYNPEEDTSVIKHINHIQYQQLKSESIIKDGMIPKLESSFRVLEAGVEEVYLGGSKILNDNNNRIKTTLTWS